MFVRKDTRTFEINSVHYIWDILKIQYGVLKF